MKKLLSILCLAALTTAAFASGKNKALYVYEKNGGLTPLMFSEVDSIRFSCLDIDSVLYNIPVTQEIWTTDSVYRLSLNELDSVSFQTPPTVLKSHSIDLTVEPIRQYVNSVSMETMKVELNAAIPSSLLPKVGDCLVAMECGGVFDHGFVGRATAVNNSGIGVIIDCEEADLTEAFDCYYGIFQTIGYDTEDADMSKEKALKKTRRRNYTKKAPEINIEGIHTFDIPPIKMKRNLENDFTFDYDVDAIFKDLQTTHSLNTDTISHADSEISLEISSIVSLNYALIIRWGEFLQRISYSESKIVDCSQSLSHTLGKEISIGTSVNRIFPQVPLLYFIDLEVGASFGGEGTVGVRHYNQTEYYYNFNYQRNSLLELGNVWGSSYSNCLKNTWDLNVGGRVGLDFHFVPMLKFLSKNLASLQADFYGGVELSGDFLYRLKQYEMRTHNSSLYDALKGNGLKFGPKRGVSIDANFGSVSQNLFSHESELKPWWECLAVPNIKDFSVVSSGSSSIVSMVVCGNCLTKHRIGFRVVRGDGSEIIDWIDDNEYKSSNEGVTYSHEFDFPITDSDEVYPLVGYYRDMIIGSPSWPARIPSPFYPFITYQRQDGVRLISGATAIGDKITEEDAFHIGNLLPFHPFTTDDEP